MTSETITLFLALLAVALVVGLVVLAVCLAVGWRGRAVVDAIAAVALEGATAVAVVSTLGSLYLSEGAGFEPCRLCWVQRAFMYPAALLLLVALVTRRRPPVMAAAVLAVIGLPVAVFHRWEQWSGEATGFCDPFNPCAARWVNHLGFITIPTMAAAGFIGVAVLATLHLRRMT